MARKKTRQSSKKPLSQDQLLKKQMAKEGITRDELLADLLTGVEHDIPLCVTRALLEDVGLGDITAKLMPEGHRSTAEIISREAAVICGQPWVNEVFRQLNETYDSQATDSVVEIEWHITEGDKVVADQKLCTLKGNSAVLLSGERSALNFLQTLSATATTSRHYAESNLNSNIKVLDTRKTIPGLRLAQKYAVAVGGCYNHRMGLYDAFLIKENHIAACGGIAKAVAAAHQLRPGKVVEVEVENLDELQQALDAKADIVMLDNFSPADIEALSEIDLGETKIEVSGDITEEKLKAYSHSAVDYISSGSLTKHIRAVDLSMRIVG